MNESSNNPVDDRSGIGETITTALRQPSILRVMLGLAATVVVLVGMRLAAPILNPILFAVVLALLASPLAPFWPAAAGVARAPPASRFPPVYARRSRFQLHSRPPRQRLRCVPGMFSRLEVKVLWVGLKRSRPFVPAADTAGSPGWPSTASPATSDRPPKSEPGRIRRTASLRLEQPHSRSSRDALKRPAHRPDIY